MKTNTFLSLPVISLSTFTLTILFILNVVCVLGSSAYVLYKVNQQSNTNLVHFAEVSRKTISLQAIRISAGSDHYSRFPDLDTLSRADNTQGICIAFIAHKDNKITSNCFASGVEKHWPDWFEYLYIHFVFDQSPISIDIHYRDTNYGQLHLTQSPNIPLNQAWNKLKDILLFSTILVFFMSLLLILTMRLALKRPVQNIIHSLNKIAEDDLNLPLVNTFQIKEWQQISHAIQHLSTTLKQSQLQNQLLAQKLVLIQEQERQYIAQELHDELAQSLTGLSATHATLKRLVVDNPLLTEHLNRATQISDNMRLQCRHILTKIRPIDMDASTFIDSLKSLIQQWNDISENTHFSLENHANTTQLRNDVCIHLYRIIQEGLTNVAKHANASQCLLSLTEKADRLEIVIKDNGHLTYWSNKQTSGFGLRGIQDRITALKGSLSILVNEPHGLCLIANIPISEC